MNRFSVLQVTESWVGPGNEATHLLYHCKKKIVISTSHFLSEFQVSEHITHGQLIL